MDFLQKYCSMLIVFTRHVNLLFNELHHKIVVSNKKMALSFNYLLINKVLNCVLNLFKKCNVFYCKDIKKSVKN